MKTADAPLPVVSGKGALLRTEDGREIIDAVSSWWTSIHGHGVESIANRIAEQFTTLDHVIFAGFTHPPAVELAERLIPHLPRGQSRIFYSDNGSTAVEIGVKMAMQYFYNQGRPRPYLIAFEEAFHGETFGAMSASGDHEFNTPFKEHLFEVKRIPAPLPGRERASLDALRAILARGESCAFLFEPLVLGAGGMLMYSRDILQQLMAECHAHDTLCIADEVMTGFCRTGQMFASDGGPERPDIVCMAKGLTGGTMPLAATSCTEDVFRAFWSDDKKKAFFHGHSFTANPVGCAAALASLDLLEAPQRQADISRISARHKAFAVEAREHSSLMDVRQTGTILAMEFYNRESTSYFNPLRDRLYHFFLDRGILLRPLGNVVYILPPYCISDAQLDVVYEALREAFQHFAPSTE